MDYDSIVKLAQDVGLNSDRARVAAAIAIAESGGDPGQVTNDSDDLSYGLWQINMIGSLGPARRKSYGLPNNEALLDPRRNAMVMADISKQGGNFSAWTTYTSGKYKKYVKDKSVFDRLKDTVSGAQDGLQNAVDTAQQTAQAAGTIASATAKTAAWISDSDNWVRIAYVIGGGLVVLVATGYLLKGTPVGDAAAKGAKYARKRGNSASK